MSPTEPRPVSVFEVVRRAVDVADPEGADDRVGEILRQFEDDDQPVRGAERLDERLAWALEGADSGVEDPQVSVTAALILYLAHRPDELDEYPANLLRLAARAEWKGSPPAAVTDWLTERGVEL